MDLGEVLEELRGLAEIEQMLIAQIFPQEVLEFTTLLPRNL
jgi:hypothetical protein